ncbi:hypothetical protein FXF51_35280 [Nonomuraea sp. PA05]|uniref:hypothetical protein n=1 Tax=Nonomuraea sp. PA05 TaxID=2604466 RepID=UPI0011D32EC8|nr:hypothetical protein [Nonomuraea sp. PA05]TYB58800.1 hypothetical protein FXF51_35280 [Nonomuraea sp. PA05]
MLFRSTRIIGVAALTLAAALAVAAPAQADDHWSALFAPADAGARAEAEADADELAARARADAMEDRAHAEEMEAKSDAAGEPGTRVHLERESVPAIVLPRELHMPICAPESGLGIPIVDEVLPQLVGCPAAALGR